MNYETRLCNNCGTVNTKDAKFCSKCGKKIGVCHNHHTHKVKTLVIIFLVVLLIVSASVVILHKYGVLNRIIHNDTSNSLIQANITNWGCAVYDGTNTYYSDGKSCIYKIDKSGKKENFIDGIYYDMGLLNKTIYCVENIEATDSSDLKNIIVGIDIRDGSKRIIYKPISTEYQLIGDNVLNDKYYFLEDHDTLFSIDSIGNVENTGFRSVKKVTTSGIYTTETSDYGLKLMSFDGKIISRYSQLDEHEVFVNFELGDNIYFTKSGACKVYYMNKKTGEIKQFSNESIFENNKMSYVNYYNGIFYVSTCNTMEDGNIEYNVFSMNSKGEIIRKIHSQKGVEGLPFCTINITPDFVIINYPITMIEPEIMRIDTVTKD